jgi:hypothetical protein
MPTEFFFSKKKASPARPNFIHIGTVFPFTFNFTTLDALGPFETRTNFT